MTLQPEIIARHFTNGEAVAAGFKLIKTFKGLGQELTFDRLQAAHRDGRHAFEDIVAWDVYFIPQGRAIVAKDGVVA